MKKIVISLIAIVTLGTLSANAGKNIFKQQTASGNSMSSVQVGYVVDGTFQIGFDAMANTGSSAFSIGVGGEYVGIDGINL